MVSIEEEYAARTKKSKELYREARKVIPGGVTHNTRYFAPYPFFTASAKGSKVIDVDGNTYVDYWIGHGSLIFGHAYPPIVKAVKEQLDKGSHYGTPHELEVELAKQVTKTVPIAQMIRFPNSGTEAALYAVRVARGYTKRMKIAKFAGGWHGGYDAVHIGVKPPYKIGSEGIDQGSIENTVILPYNNLESVERVVKNERLAAVFVEPVLGGGGAVAAEREFLKGLRELCTETQTLLVFDEVITGFRLAPGGAPEYFDVNPDLVMYGKILGGGFPIGGIAGPREIMERLDIVSHKQDLIYQGGTFCGNPITMTAGLTALRLLEDGKVHHYINKATARMKDEIRTVFEKRNIPVQVTGEGSVFCAHFTSDSVRNSADVWNANMELQRKYHLYLIAHGVLNLPHHMGLVSYVHQKDDFNKVVYETENFVKSLS